MKFQIKGQWKIILESKNNFPVFKDHSNDVSVKELFERIRSEQGRLDVLVNNAYAGVDMIRYVNMGCGVFKWGIQN